MLAQLVDTCERFALGVEWVGEIEVSARSDRITHIDDHVITIQWPIQANRKGSVRSAIGEGQVDVRPSGNYGGYTFEELAEHASGEIELPKPD